MKLESYSDQELAERTSSVRAVLLLLAIAVTLYAAIMSIVFSEHIFRWIGLEALTVTFTFVALWLNGRGHVRAVVICALIYFWMVITGFALTSGGIRGPAAVMYLGLVFSAGLFFGKNVAIFAAIVCSLSDLGFVYLSAHGLLPAPISHFNDIRFWIAHTFVLSLSVILPSVVTRSIRNALHKATDEINERKSAEAALFTSRQMLRLVLDTIPQRVFWKDQNLKYLGCNESFAEDCGYEKPEDVIGLDDHDIASVQTADLYRADDREIIEKDLPKLMYEEPQVRSDGALAWLITSKVPLHDADGKVIGVLGTYEDITDRKNAARAVLESESKYHRLIESMPDGYYRSTPEGKFIDINPAFARLLGYTREELLEMDIPNALYFDKSERDDLVKDPESKSGTEIYRLKRKDGTEVWLEDHARYVRDDQGKMVYHEGICRDITERKRAEEALKRQRLLFENFADVILYFRHSDGKIIEANRAAETAYGYSRDELLTKTIYDFSVNETSEEVQAQIGKAYSSGIVLETVHRRRDGSTFPVEVRSGGLTMGGERVLVSVIRDLTERNQLQEQLIQSQKLEGLGLLAGGVAHDYNNILNVIMGYTDILRSKLEKDDPDRQRLEVIMSAANRGAALTRQLLVFARKDVVSPRAINMNSSIESIRKMMETIIGENIKLVSIPGDRLWNVYIDPSQLDQVIMNLVTNSRDAIDGVGTISIKTFNMHVHEKSAERPVDLSPGDYAVLSITDTGRGMREDVLKRLFEPFFTTKPKGRGTGLGLSTVYGIVKQNNGAIDVASKPGVGTRFQIFLPRYCGEPEELEEDISEEPLKGTETVLVVEDQAELLDLVKFSLEEFGYSVLSAIDPHQALLICEAFPKKIDLLLTDVIMPTMSGKQLSKRILALKPDTKVLYMSGYTANELNHHGVLADDINFIQKPFNVIDLLKKMRGVLDK
ncbi:MAG TPA: PAS domain S-box protein [Candidatus Acidoferrales bacterium]|nr:PAS domain S-box protein [Candidatus Acidoferrales bacterium]